MVARREPNERLRALLAEARWTGAGLARAVNAIGAESGLPLSCTRASVSHWLAGVRPRPPVPELVAEALSRRLRRPVTARAAGLAMGDESVTPDPWAMDDPAAALVELSAIDADPNRRARLREVVYTLTEAQPPPWSGLPAPAGLAGPATPSAAHPATRAAGGPAGDSAGGRLTPTRQRGWPAQADAAVRVAGFFAAADATFGGGHARAALAAYLASDLAPRLRDGGRRLGLQRRMLTTAANLAYLCGFMCFDDDMQGAAQQYYLTALRLAAESGDRVAYGVVLGAMSAQAHYLGHHVQALRLAEAAANKITPKAGPITVAFMLGQLAVARAFVGERGAALADLRGAERRMDRANPIPDVIGPYQRASLDHQRAEVLLALGDRRGAISAMTAALRHRRSGERRSHTVTLAWLAGIHLDAGHLEVAVETWHRFLDGYPYLRSGWADAAFATLRARIRPHRGNAAAWSLWRRAAEMSEPAGPDRQ
ncbi:MAG TPA: hypothetical protein VF069_13525 [Streptosporangiaceae bacterium]